MLWFHTLSTYVSSKLLNCPYDRLGSFNQALDCSGNAGSSSAVREKILSLRAKVKACGLLVTDELFDGG